MIKKISPLFFIQLVISGTALFFIVRRLDGGASLATLHALPPFIWIAASLGTAAVAHGIGVWRWQVLGNAALQAPRPFAFYLRYYLIGLFYATFVPGGQLMGEGVKIARMMPDASRRAALIGSIVADRLIGLAAGGALLVSLFLGSPFIRSSPVSGVGFFVGATIVAVSAAGCVWFLFSRRGAGSIMTASRSGGAGYIRSLLRTARESADLFSTKKQALATSFLGAVAFHAAAGLLLYLTVRAYGGDANIFFVTWIYLIASIALVLPVHYAGFGIREGVVVPLLVFAGVAGGEALLISLFFFGIQATFALTGGIWDFKDIRDLYDTLRR